MNNDYQEMRDKQTDLTHSMTYNKISIKNYYNIFLMSIMYFIAYIIDICVFERNSASCDLHNNGERMNYMNR